MKDELTTKMHSEFSVDAETELRHKALCIWGYGLYETEEEIRDACEEYGITYEQALKFKDEFQ